MKPIDKFNNMTASRVREVLDYDPVSGIFRWRVALANRVKVGSIAGSLVRGYRRVMIDGFSYYAHRLAWLHMTGEWPENEIDHRNRNEDDNRWTNLRLADRSQNCANGKMNCRNLSGLKGVTTDRGRYRAKIVINGKIHRLGSYRTPEAAHAAYATKAVELFGEFSRTV